MPEFVKQLFSPLMREFFAATSSELGAMARREDLRRMLLRGLKEQAWEALRHVAAVAILFAGSLLFLLGLVHGAHWLISIDCEEWHYLLFIFSMPVLGLLILYASLERHWEDSRDIPDVTFRNVLDVYRLASGCVAAVYGFVRRLTLLQVATLLLSALTFRWVLTQ